MLSPQYPKHNKVKDNKNWMKEAEDANEYTI
jgi:hypothetical protein